MCILNLNSQLDNEFELKVCELVPSLFSNNLINFSKNTVGLETEKSQKCAESEFSSNAASVL